MPIQPGARLGPYAIVATVARGGMGEVYEACDTRLDRRVAIKTLRSELLADPQARRRFEREARALSSLSHPNICTVFDVGSHGEVDFIVMEFVDGRPLSALLDEQSLDPQSVVRIAMEVARALADAHDHGVLHRDIKPQNVMITARGDVKVLDFGLAKEIGGLPGEAATTAAASFQGSLAGTAPYMSPEQVRGEPLDARSDVFSLGSLLYELITGRAPFQRRTAAETLAAILGAEPAPLARLASDTSDQLQRIVGKCLEKDRTRRYQTARDVATDLDNLPRDSSRATPSIDSTAGRAGSPDRRLLGSRSARITVAAAALLVALATSAIGFRWTMRPRNAAELRTLAILPLQPLSDSAGENYFGLGIADALITRISGTPSLTVRPTSAVRPYTDGKVDALTAAAALQVDAVLDGAWQRESDRLRVSINLLRVRDGASLWTETVDLPANDVFAVQDKLSQQLAARLQLELDASRAARARKSAGGTHNPQAYDAYLRGSFYLSAREISPQRRQNIDAAIESFERAVALDPKFAEARARLGFAYAYVALAMENNPQLIERARVRPTPQPR